MENQNTIKTSFTQNYSLFVLIGSISIVLSVFAVLIYLEQKSSEDLPNTCSPRLCYLDHFFHLDIDHNAIDRETRGIDREHEKECLDSYDRVTRDDKPSERDYERAAEYISDYLS